MGLEFEALWALMLLPVGPGPPFGSSTGAIACAGHRFAGGSRWACGWLLCAVLALAAAAPSVPGASGAAQRWVVLDMSDSTCQAQDGAQAVTARALADLPQGAAGGRDRLGADAMVDVPAALRRVHGRQRGGMTASGSDLDACASLGWRR